MSILIPLVVFVVASAVLLLGLLRMSKDLLIRADPAPDFSEEDAYAGEAWDANPLPPASDNMIHAMIMRSIPREPQK